uniref:Uncharacterized protein n=1 Tax=viral metagenome TaxID=1070528 RepID=A0A6C0E1V0_9ZZZZ
MTHLLFILITIVLITSYFYFSFSINEDLRNISFYAHNSSNISNIDDNYYFKIEIDMLRDYIQQYFPNNDLQLRNFIQDYDVKYFYAAQFKNVVLTSLTKLFESSEHFKDYKLNSKENIDVFYKLQVGNDRFFKFDIEIFAINKPFSFKAQIILQVSNMISYLTPDNSYQNIIPLDTKSIKITNINIYDYVSPSKLALESNVDATNFYKIKSKLYIFDPLEPSNPN